MVGQDKRELGAILISDEEALLAAGLVAPSSPADGAAAAAAASDEHARLERLLSSEAARALAAAMPDHRPEERVARFALVRAPLSPDDGTLTRTMKPRRAAILERESEAFGTLMAQLRG